MCLMTCMQTETNYEKLFQSLRHIEPPQELYGGIVARITREQRHRAIIRLFFLGFAVLLSFAALIPTFRYLSNDFYQSGSYQYLSLIFSDGGMLISYWKEFMLSIAESLPIISIAAFLSILFIMLGSLKLAAQNIKTAFLSTSPI